MTCASAAVRARQRPLSAKATTTFWRHFRFYAAQPPQPTSPTCKCTVDASFEFEKKRLTVRSCVQSVSVSGGIYVPGICSLPKEGSSSNAAYATHARNLVYITRSWRSWARPKARIGAAVASIRQLRYVRYVHFVTLR